MPPGMKIVDERWMTQVVRICTGFVAESRLESLGLAEGYGRCNCAHSVYDSCTGPRGGKFAPMSEKSF
jgi:hypothetical protein